MNYLSWFLIFSMTFLFFSFFSSFYLPHSSKFLTDSICFFLVICSSCPRDCVCFLCIIIFLLFSLMVGLKLTPLSYCKINDFLKFNSSLFFSRSRFSLEFGPLLLLSLCVFALRIGRDCIWESSVRYWDIFSCRSPDLVGRKPEVSDSPWDPCEALKVLKCGRYPELYDGGCFY